MNIEKKADNRNFLVCDGCYMVSVLFSFENNAMLHFLFVFLLASLAPFGISNIIEKGSEIKRNQKTIEIIVQKYKALGSSEIDEIKDERYDFRLCACENKTGKSERSNSCNCSTVASGLTTYNSIPQTLYSSSCIRNPQYKKCLIAQVTVNTTQIAKIEQCLLQNAKKYHLLPSQFSIATYKNAILTLHNVYRSKHGAGLLKVNIELERTAEIWAHRLASRADCLIHDPSKRFGENLFYYATNLLPDEETMALMTVQSFYLEAYGYNYKTSVTTKLYSEKKEAKHKPLQMSSHLQSLDYKQFAHFVLLNFMASNTSRHHYLDYNHTGHFTQLVWKSTTQMGVGIAMRRFSGHQANSCQPDFPSILFYVVIKYDPPGNILDMKNYDDNVLPPIR
ncbi:SCP-like protein [Onchocerca flexuosa]|uniref:SCP-like protein n=1 Tax=Onchocerca flexuosa TaxID=387005 RepID=A0A238BU27_9BILA|nr:SCP-like protein [Onchocerca flexuosa]